MRFYLLYIFLFLSSYLYGQCDADLIGGTYNYIKSSDTLEVDTYISTDTSNNTIFVLDFYDKPDIINNRIEFNVIETKSYKVKRILCNSKIDGSYLLKIKRNKENIKWIYIDNTNIILNYKRKLKTTYFKK